MKILQKESELEEIVKLVGVDALSNDDRVTLEIARSVREDYLQQNSFELTDSYTELDKQDALLDLIFHFENKAREVVARGANIDAMTDLPVRERIGRAKSVLYKDYKKIYAEIAADIEKELDGLAVAEI